MEILARAKAESARGGPGEDERAWGRRLKMAA